ncbi:MAG TPA: helicase C-terminal domain-containing protein, partial [Candidatus Limnocylindria bacterium]|nr:helicase C-terminal domain-containing protein [Candidatus Limnocylindria bacterium]
RVRLERDGTLTAADRFATFVDPGIPVGPAITRLTGIRDVDLAGAPSVEAALPNLAAFLGDAPIVGHNIAFDLAFLEHAGLSPHERLDTVELASILMPTAPTYALQALAAAADIHPGAAHRALDDALTCAAVLADLAERARALSPSLLAEAQAYAALLGGPFESFFADASADTLRGAWDERRLAPPPRAAAAPAAGALAVSAVFAPDGPLARGLAGYEERAQQRDLARAIESTFADGGVLVAEAGTGVGKSLAYLVPALSRALGGERVVVSTHTLPLQDQLVRKDLPALQEALGTRVPVTVLKGRSNYLCPRRWQQFRGAVATREEARLLLKTLVWRAQTASGDRAELNLLGAESDLWPRISADDETCDARRCARVSGGCYLQRAREAAANAGIVVTNHALLLQDARMRGALLPASDHLVVDEAHRLEEVATDAFGLTLEDRLVRRALDRVSRAPAVTAGLRDDRAVDAETVRREVATAHERAAELFTGLAAVVGGGQEERLRVTGGLRASDERWLPVEIAGERLADAVGGVATASDRLAARTTDEDEQAELASAVAELTGIRIAISRGIHAPRPGDIVWLDRPFDAPVALRVAPSHLGDAIRRGLVERRRSAVFTSATLAVAGSFAFALDRFGVGDVADAHAFGSPFDYAKQAILVVPDEGALPGEPDHADETAETVAEIGRALEGRTLVLFTAHGAMRDVASRLAGLEESGIAVLTQGIDGSRRALLERFAAGRAVLLGTQSFWEGIDLPGDILQCVVITRLPFAVPDDPLVQGRSERYEDPFREFHLPQAALRLRQGFGRLIRTRSDRGAVVLLDRRALVREYGPELLAALPDARVRRVPREAIAMTVAQFCGR